MLTSLPATSPSVTALRVRHRLALLALAVMTGLGGTLALTPGAEAKAPPAGLGGFTAESLISDAQMFAGTAMTAAQVDAFLDEKGAACTRGSDGADCLKDLTMDTPARAKSAYCAAIPAAKKASAGKIIADVSRACSLNPRVLLVMLQKEQGLITTRNATPKMLDEALGFACPDFQACDPKHAGFAQQVYNAGSRLQEYGDATRGYRYRAGGTYDIQYSPYAFCGYGKVTIANRATAALYNYTPYTPTQATLDAGSAAVAHDVCATYGNRNFFRLYSQWFGSPTGASTARYPAAAPQGRSPANPFVDVRHGSTAFFTEISWMKHKGHTTGWPDGTYRPLQPIARDAMIAFLYRVAGSPAFTPPKLSPFTDVRPGNNQFYKEITWAHSVGLANGWPDGTFRPHDPIKRDAMAAFLYRASGSPAYTPPATSPFTDVRSGSNQFSKEISWMAAKGYSTGWSDGTYRPLQPVRRDAVAAFVYRWKVP
jgi:hypothetical protein